jgi:hypothetical protein
MPALHLPNVPFHAAVLHHRLLRGRHDRRVVQARDVGEPALPDCIAPRGRRAGRAEAEQRVREEGGASGGCEGAGDLGVEGVGGRGDGAGAGLFLGSC